MLLITYTISALCENFALLVFKKAGSWKTESSIDWLKKYICEIRVKKDRSQLTAEIG